MKILDNNEVSFSLEKLHNCSFLDAYNILNCKRKILEKHEKAFLVPKDQFNIFTKSDFYMQTISLPKPKNIVCDDHDDNDGNDNDDNDEIFLVEEVVAAFCNSIQKINYQDWWIAAYCSTNHLRIIAGIGKGIKLSRFLLLNSDILVEISKTIMYLQRFGMSGNVKVFSSLDQPIVNTSSQKSITIDQHYIEKFNGKIIEDFASSNKIIAPIITNKRWFEKFINNKMLCVVLLIITLLFLYMDNCTKNYQKIISSLDHKLQNNVHVVTNGVEFAVNKENYHLVNQYVNDLNETCNPIDLLFKTFKLCRKYNITVDQLSFEDGNQVKIETTIDKKKWNDLIQHPDIKKVEKNSTNEYEEFESKHRVTICVK